MNQIHKVKKKNLRLFNRKKLDHIPTPADIKAANDIYMVNLKEFLAKSLL